METIGGYHLKRLEKQVVKLRWRLERNTQKLREKLLSDLETMFNIAKANVEAARHEKDKAKQVQLWIRIMGYLGQVMNSLADSFDEAKAMEYLKRLQEMAQRGQAETDSQTGGEAGEGDTKAAES